MTMMVPRQQPPEDLPTMPSEAEIMSAITTETGKYLLAHPPVQPGHRCAVCSRVYANGSTHCEEHGDKLLPAPELQRAVRVACNGIGIFVRRFGAVLLGPYAQGLVELQGWSFDIRPWLERTRGIRVGDGGLRQMAPRNVPDPR